MCVTECAMGFQFNVMTILTTRTYFIGCLSASVNGELIMYNVCIYNLGERSHTNANSVVYFRKRPSNGRITAQYLFN